MAKGNGIMIKIFIDTETTGCDRNIHSLHQVAGLIEVDGKIVDKFLLKMAPTSDEAEPMALEKCQTSMDELMKNPNERTVWKEFTTILRKHMKIDDRAFFIAYNSKFDEDFIRSWMKRNNSDYSRWFYTPSICIMALAGEALMEVRHQMPNFKLETVVKVFEELENKKILDESKLHNALYDIVISKYVYENVKKLLKGV